MKYASLEGVVLFRLSNRIIQAMFSDRLSFVLSSEGQHITVLDSIGSPRHHLHLATLFSPSLSTANPVISEYRTLLVSLRDTFGKLIYCDSPISNKS